MHLVPGYRKRVSSGLMSNTLASAPWNRRLLEDPPYPDWGVGRAPVLFCPFSASVELGLRWACRVYMRYRARRLLYRRYSMPVTLRLRSGQRGVGILEYAALTI